MNKILNVIVYYNNDDEVRLYISEINKFAADKVDIILVINKDTDELAPKIIEDQHILGFNNIYLKDFKENIGYLNALLEVITKIDIEKYEYFILSNTDIEYPIKDFFDKLLTKKYSNDIGCIAPSVYSTRFNRYSNPHYKKRITLKKLNRLIRIFSCPILASLYIWLSKEKILNRKKIEEPSCYVYSPHGCYMIFAKAFVKDIKGFRYGAKLYSEESCIGELLIKHNKKCFYDNSIKIYHMESTVTGKMDNRIKFKCLENSLRYIKNKFYI